MQVTSSTEEWSSRGIKSPRYRAKASWRTAQLLGTYRAAFFRDVLSEGPEDKMVMIDLRLTEYHEHKRKVNVCEHVECGFADFNVGNLSEELYQVIIQCSGLSPTYKVFIKQLKENMISGLVSVSLVSNFEKSLLSTTTGRKISMSCDLPAGYLHLFRSSIRLLVKDVKWMKELKLLSYALSGRTGIVMTFFLLLAYHQETGFHRRMIWMRREIEIAVVTHSGFLCHSLKSFGSSCHPLMKVEVCKQYFAASLGV
ncbi:hypothetical protein C5167_039991 [Papaver somniferum]|uniref:Uncharacterized protein n=1 Tax=Papaver somniferum TaxID=3469 RepID=A0A4Y7IDV3_PAPSO|nr:hypothetical protein C5167_039991 [Papaver somniferum]